MGVSNKHKCDKHKFCIRIRSVTPTEDPNKFKPVIRRITYISSLCECLNILIPVTVICIYVSV